MTVRGLDQALRNLEQLERRIVGEKTERAITRILISISVESAQMIPIMTSNLINSEFREVFRRGASWKGEIGYGANYAEYVHDAPGTLLGKNVQRDSNRPGFGYAWDPDAEPEFLLKGGEKVERQDLSQILTEEYRV